MNPFVIELSKKEISTEPDLVPKKLSIEDNIGESVHIHYRNLRIEFTIDEFLKFENHITHALEELEKWE